MSMTGQDRRPRALGPRLWRSVERYGRIGATTAGGVSRPIFSPAENRARHQLIADARALGLATRVDAAANVFCTRPGADPTLPAILVGSHLDSVPDGGRFDGALGVLCGLEVLRALAERDHATRHTVGLVALSGEEATASGTSTFGSRALAGRLPDVGAHLLADGRRVDEALRDAGGDWDALPHARDALGPIACFLEVHIEQGRRLERMD